LEQLNAALLGLVEGLTEFLPVSSTGHLILVGDLLGFQGPAGFVFEIAIQLGAILAICVLYAGRIARVVAALPTEAGARRFAAAVVIAFLPAAVLGALFHDAITTVLFSPVVVSIALVLGGIVILAVERMPLEPRYREAESIPLRTALAIGVCQAAALVPGVSRSGATILGALVLGVERRAAAEFSFFVAIPTMLGATVWDLWKTRHALDLGGIGLIAIGFAVAFVAALVVIRPALAFITRRGFSPFGWYRIAVGGAMLLFLALR
jgi:undecaprenyl-diphosphatase